MIYFYDQIGIDREQLIEELCVFIVGGHETSAHSKNKLFFLLYQTICVCVFEVKCNYLYKKKVNAH